MRLVLTNLMQRGKQLISLNDTGLLNQKIQFSGSMGSKQQNARVKVQNDIHPSTHIYKQISPTFNCVTPESVSLANYLSQV